MNSAWNCLPIATVFCLYNPASVLIHRQVLKRRQTESIVDNETLGSTSDLLTLEEETNTLSRNVSTESPPYAELYPRTAQIFSYVIFNRSRTFFRRPLMCLGFHHIICYFPSVFGDVGLKHIKYC